LTILSNSQEKKKNAEDFFLKKKNIGIQTLKKKEKKNVQLRRTLLETRKKKNPATNTNIADFAFDNAFGFRRKKGRRK
jgi:hypothetical protein